MAGDAVREWWRAYQQRRADSPWPRKSPRRFRAVIMPGIVAVLGLLLLLFVPSVYLLGLAICLGGLAGMIIAFLLAAVGD